MKQVKMNEMKAGQLGVVDDKLYPEFDGHLVMRTLSSQQIEVIDLTSIATKAEVEDNCWTGTRSTVNVILVPSHMAKMALKDLVDSFQFE